MEGGSEERRGGERGGGDGGKATRGPARRGEKGGNEAHGSAKGGGEVEGAGLPIDAGIVTCEPREAQHQLEMGQIYKLKGNLLGMPAMNADTGRKKMGDRGG